MENREQMIHVATGCFSYEEAVLTSSCAGKSCAKCTHCLDSFCMKDLFEEALIAID